MANPRTPEDLLATELKQVHSAERQLTRAIPRLSRAVESEELRRMLDVRRQQGERLIEDIDNALEKMGTAKARPKNPAAEGLLEDMNEHLEMAPNKQMADAMLLAGVQKLEHYCLAAWGTARSMAQLLDETEVVRSMERALDEGKKLDSELTRLAEKEINPAMLRGEGATDGGRRSSSGGLGESRSSAH